jgi:hypothetical protein
MVVGVCRLVLGLPGVDSLKGKRSIVRRLIDRVRHRFNAAVAEVASLDAHRRAVLGFAVVSNDARHANAMVDTIVAYVSGASEALILDRTMEILHLEEHLGVGLEEVMDRGGVGRDGDDDDR